MVKNWRLMMGLVLPTSLTTMAPILETLSSILITGIRPLYSEGIETTRAKIVKIFPLLSEREVFLLLSMGLTRGILMQVNLFHRDLHMVVYLDPARLRALECAIKHVTMSALNPAPLLVGIGVVTHVLHLVVTCVLDVPQCVTPPAKPSAKTLLAMLVLKQVLKQLKSLQLVVMMVFRQRTNSSFRPTRVMVVPTAVNSILIRRLSAGMQLVWASVSSHATLLVLHLALAVV